MKRLSMTVRAVVARAMARKKAFSRVRSGNISPLIEALESRLLLSASPFTTSNFTLLGGDSVILAGPGGAQCEPRLDLNGDGQADLIVQYENRLCGGPVTGHAVAALLTNAQGPMTEVTIIHMTSPAAPIQSIATDVTNDGRIDVVVYRSDGAFNAHRFLDVFVGQADGTFTVGQSIDLGTALPDSKLTVFDMTGDGIADLHLRDGSKVTVYRGVGNGTFANPVVSNFPAGLVTGIDFEHDMTGDGIADMVISVDSFIQQTLGVYRGLATGGYNTGSPTYLNTADNLTLSAVLQLTNDTAPEIVAYSAASFAPLGAPVTVRIYRNNGTGGFAQGFASTPLANGFYSQNIAGVPVKPLLSPDLDGDGDLDLILLEGSGLTSDLVVRVLRNNGNAAFSQMASINVSDFLSLSNVFAEDVDNDGFVDIFVQRHNLAKGWYGTTYFNNGDDSFSGVGATVLPAQQVGSVAPVLVDLNSDGRLDVLLASSSPASVEGFLYSTGRIFLAPVVTAGIGGNVTLNPVPRDLNGDGLPDIIAYRSNGPSANAAGFTVYTGTGNGGFTLAEPTVINAHDVNNNILPTLGDINGDGRADLIFTGEQATTDNFSGIYVVLNNALPPTDTAGTNAAAALDLGTITAPLSLVEYVGPDLGADPRDRFDFFRLTLDAARKVRFTVTPEVTSVYMSVLPESGIGGLGSVFPSSGLPGFLDLDMQPGTYHINANKGGGAGSRYRLDIEFPDAPAAIGVLNGLDAIQSGQVAAVNYGTVARTATDTTNNTEFLVRNTGSTPLNLASLILPPGFVLGRDPLVTALAPGASDTFTVNLDTSTLERTSSIHSVYPQWR